MQIITNDKRPTHLSIINKLINNSDEIIICVAFLKNSGLNKIIEKLTNSCTFYIGIDYYITEPTAVKRLIKSGHTVYFIKKTKSSFHPKIYYSRQGNNISILTGSANLTGGGLETNFEASIILQAEVGSSLDKDFSKMISVYSKHLLLFVMLAQRIAKLK